MRSRAASTWVRAICSQELGGQGGIHRIVWIEIYRLIFRADVRIA